MHVAPAAVGLGDAYTDCLGACVEQSLGADPELMAQCVATCKENFSASSRTGGTSTGTGLRANKDLIPGVSNTYLVIGAGVAVLFALLMGRR